MSESKTAGEFTVDVLTAALGKEWDLPFEQIKDAIDLAQERDAQIKAEVEKEQLGEQLYAQMQRCIEHLDKAGFGNPGASNTLEGMVLEAIGKIAEVEAKYAPLVEAAKSVHEVVCSYLCPSLKKEGEEWSHVDKCRNLRLAIVMAETKVPSIAEAEAIITKSGMDFDNFSRRLDENIDAALSTIKEVG
jgi:hypothetical protein